MQDKIVFRNREEWNLAWKYIDNCWRIELNTQNEVIYGSKLNRPRKSKKNQNGTLWKQRDCPAKMKVVMEGDEVFVEKYGIWNTHNHSIDVMDELGSCSFIREYIKNEASRGYSYQAISKAFHNQFDTVGIGARYVTLERVRRYSCVSTTITTEESIENHLTCHHFKSHSCSLAIGICKQHSIRTFG